MPDRVTPYSETWWMPEDIAQCPGTTCRFCGRPLKLGQFIVHLKDGSIAHDVCNEDAVASGAYV